MDKDKLERSNVGMVMELTVGEVRAQWAACRLLLNKENTSASE